MYRLSYDGGSSSSAETGLTGFFGRYMTMIETELPDAVAPKTGSRMAALETTSTEEGSMTSIGDRRALCQRRSRMVTRTRMRTIVM